MKKEIPLAKPWMGTREYEVLKDVVLSGWLSQGKKVEEFEKIVSRYVKSQEAVCVSSCTTALHLSLVLAGISAGDEVICPSFSFIASSNVIEYVGAKPVFADIDEKTFNLDPESLKEKITSRTRAVVLVHQVGLAADLDAVNKIAAGHNLTVIEDAACAIGGVYKGRMIGEGSQYCCFSFHPRKIICTGEGGMVVTASSSIADKLKALRSHGASISAVEKHRSMGLLHESFPELGYNYRMTDMQAAVGIVQMEKLDQMLKKRQEIAANYERLLQDTGEIILPCVPADRKHTFQSYLIKIKPGLNINVNDLLKFMAEHGISCRKSIQSIHLEPYYLNKYGRVELPVTESVAKRGLFLPIYHALTLSDQEYIADILKKGLIRA